jgi:hypothetical protein
LWPARRWRRRRRRRRKVYSVAKGRGGKFIQG